MGKKPPSCDRVISCSPHLFTHVFRGVVFCCIFNSRGFNIRGAGITSIDNVYSGSPRGKAACVSESFFDALPSVRLFTD